MMATQACAKSQQADLMSFRFSRWLSISRYFSLLHFYCYLKSWYLKSSTKPTQIITWLESYPSLMASSSHNPSNTLQLTEEENLIHDFDHVSLHSGDYNSSYCLVFNILTIKTPKPLWIKKAMSEAWALRFPVEITDYHSGLFLATFQCEDKRQGIALPDNSCVPPSKTVRPPNKGITIQVLSSVPTATTVGVKRPFTRQHTQVGGSVRSMLKRARASNEEDIVVPSLSNSNEMLRKMNFISWNARGLGSPRAFQNFSLLARQHQPVLFFCDGNQAPGRPRNAY
uniref:DUF4283 domain-containing protein n=1 Tax=Cannabis sativa TaxID=3483 RepID=A0A803PC36_CANSA